MASDYLCGKLLAPMMAPLLTALERHHALHVPAGSRYLSEESAAAVLEQAPDP